MNVTGQRLAEALADEVASMELLAEILQRENLALIDRDSEVLQQVTADKNHALKVQSQKNALRRSISDPLTADIEGEQQALEVVFQQFSNGDELIALLRRFKDIAAECQQVNRSNGRLIARQQQHTQEALAVLQRTDGSADPTYSQRGPAGNTPSKRILGTA